MSKNAYIIIPAFMLAMSLVVNAGEVKGWPEQVKSVKYPASIDKSQQPMPEKNRIAPELIQAFYEKQALPAGLDIIRHTALNWLAQQRKDKPANWNVAAEYKLKTDENENVSGK